MSQETYDVIRGIAQAAADGYDGALDENGEPIKIGLKREEGNPLLDSRTMDGFKVNIAGSNLILTYQCELSLRDVYGAKLENELEQTMADIVKFLKKRYRKITKKSLGLTPVGECDAMVQKINNRMIKCNAKKMYKISNLNDVDNLSDSKRGDIEKSFKSFLELGGLGNKAKNDKRKG